MRHLSRLFQRSSKFSGKRRHDPVLDGEPAFPTELFIHIVSFIEYQRDLVTLCLVSKTFRDICMPLLYKHITIKLGQNHLETHSGIYKTLQRPSITCMVVFLSISLNKGPLCGRLNPSWSLLQRNRCTCTSHDSFLGEVILSLQSLQSLIITCTLCCYSHGHEYLFKLSSPALRLFMFYCYGSTAFGGDGRSVLLVPFMSQITTLSLQCEQTRLGNLLWNGVLAEQLLQEANGLLSHLDTLILHSGWPLFDLLLSRCRIRRLYFTKRLFAVPVTAIRRSPGRLTHLFFPNLLYWLPRDMKLGIEPYIHLRFIGIVEVNYLNVGSSQFRFRENTLD